MQTSTLGLAEQVRYVHIFNCSDDHSTDIVGAVCFWKDIQLLHPLRFLPLQVVAASASALARLLVS